MVLASNKDYPKLSARSLGWLRYLHRKTHTPDNLDKDGQPHEHWDNRTGEPTTSWHRFDLFESSYSVALMADTTPAWREVYSSILDEIVERYSGYWAAKDWLDQIGEDPRRGNYPEGFLRLLPEHLVDDYDVPGWTANGVEPWGLQMDPVGADGNLFYRGWFLVVMGLHRYVSGDSKWNDPFDVVRDGENTFSWTHEKMARFLHDQWVDRPEGPH